MPQLEGRACVPCASFVREASFGERRMMKVFMVLCLSLPLLGGCASEAYDSLYDQEWEAMGAAWNAVDAPFGLATSAWTDPHKRDAEDITLADFPYFMFSAADPWNVLPPPFGTMYVPWKLFVTAIRAFPFVTWGSKGDSQGVVTFSLGDQPGPLWVVIGPALSTVDSFVLPVGETVAADHTPVPHGGDFHKYWSSRIESHRAHFTHIGNMFRHYLFGTNYDQPPYDIWFPDVMQRDKTTIHKTIDHWLFLYDWDDPYIN